MIKLLSTSSESARNKTKTAISSGIALSTHCISVHKTFTPDLECPACKELLSKRRS